MIDAKLNSDTAEIENLDKLVERLSKLDAFLSRLEKLIESGILDTLIELIELIHMSKDFIGEDMVGGTAHLMSEAMEMTSKLSQPTMKKLIRALLDHQIELRREIERTKINGIIDLIRILRDRDVRNGLAVIIAILKILGRYGYMTEDEEKGMVN